MKSGFLCFNFSYRRSTSSWLRPPFPFPVTLTVGSPPKIIQLFFDVIALDGPPGKRQMTRADKNTTPSQK